MNPTLQSEQPCLADTAHSTGVGESGFPPCSLPSLFVTSFTSLVYLICRTLLSQLYLPAILCCSVSPSPTSPLTGSGFLSAEPAPSPHLTPVLFYFNQTSSLLSAFSSWSPVYPFKFCFSFPFTCWFSFCVYSSFSSHSGLDLLDYLIKRFLTLPIILLFTPLHL